MSCGEASSNSALVSSHEKADSGITEIQLTSANFDRYLSYQAFDQQVGVVYAAWIEFKGVLTFAVYDVTVDFVVIPPAGQEKIKDSIALDASGGGKTDLYTFHSTFEITSVVGTVCYRVSVIKSLTSRVEPPSR